MFFLIIIKFKWIKYIKFYKTIFYYIIYYTENLQFQNIYIK